MRLSPLPVLTLAVAVSATVTPARAQEAFAGVYAHAAETPFTFDTGERGADIAAGYRFAPIAALAALGRPAPYVLVSANTRGDTSFAAAGLHWTIGKGRFYVRPGIGIAVHDGPSQRIDLAAGRHTDLGSRVLFEPEIGVGYRLNARLSAEASWMHISQAQLFNRRQNPGIDMIGMRLNLKLD